MKGKNPYQTPSGYFSDLQLRLRQIPAGQEAAADTVTLWAKVKPYAALAASFVAAFFIGDAVLRTTSDSTPAAEYTYAEFLSMTHPMTVYTAMEESYSSATTTEVTDSDIENYLIATGVSAETLEYLLAENQ